MRRTQGQVARTGSALLLAGATLVGMMLAGAGVASATSGSGSGYSGPVLNAGYPNPNMTTGPVSIQVPTSANVVSGGGDGANIECAWILPDLNPSGGSQTSNTDPTAVDYTGAPYSASPGATAPTTMTYGLSDNPSQMPISGNTATGASAVPCDVPSSTNVNPNTNAPNASQGAPFQVNGASNMTEVLPNAFDSPAPRRVELWAAVDNSTGLSAISDVFWKVYYPNGQLDVQVHGVPIEGSGNAACQGPNSYQSGGMTMFQAAIAEGEVSSAAASAMTTLCEENVKSLWHNAFTISKDDPNGTYTVETDTVVNGAVTTLDYTFNVIPFFDFGIDFSQVNFGTLSPGQEKTLAGNTNFNAPNSTTPTVTNGGNSGMQVGVQYFPMIQQTDAAGNPVQGGKTISTFDAAFGYNANYLQTISTINAASGSPGPTNTNSISWFAGTGAQLVCPNDTPKLDLSVSPPSTLPAGGYLGALVLWAQSSVVTTEGGCPTDNGAPYSPVAGDVGAPVR